MPFTYLRILFAASQCVVVGLVINRLIKLIVYIRSGLVTVKYIRQLTNYLYNVSSICSPFVFVDSLVLNTIGFFTTLLSNMRNLDNTSRSYIL